MQESLASAPVRAVGILKGLATFRTANVLAQYVLLTAPM